MNIPLNQKKLTRTKSQQQETHTRQRSRAVTPCEKPVLTPPKNPQSLHQTETENSLTQSYDIIHHLYASQSQPEHKLCFPPPHELTENTVSPNPLSH